MAISSTDRRAKNVQVFVEKDAVETSFAKWAQPGHFSRTLAKGPKTTTWIWNLHADVHDFDSQTSSLEEVSPWLNDPVNIKQSSQVVWPIVGQEVLNGDVGGNFQGVQTTSGCHAFGFYIHNDTMRALGRPQDMFSDKAIQLQPIFAQWIQNIHLLAPGTTAPNALATTSYAFGGEVVEVGGVLYARSSKLIPDKANLGFRFPCDGPGRGGTCQSSSWDHVVILQKVQSPLMAGYVIFYGHKLHNGRGYWQELIESIVWAHNKLNFAPAIQPRALSITQGRAVGLAHYLLGGIGTTWSFFLARAISIS
eukprot:scaffold25935_cov2061-Cylindrotheca_fusiformis.AAC.1